jgi:hypothetical protein
MKKYLLVYGFFIFAGSASAQNSLPMYAVTSENQSFEWIHLKQVDAAKGRAVRTLFDGNKQNTPVWNAVTKQVLSQRPEGEFPTTTMVAALAYAKSAQKLFFIPMRIPELRWTKLENNQPVHYSFHSEALSKLNLNDDANHITRMCMGADGFGYALTNDGTHLIRFSTKDQPEIVDLGSLADAPANKEISIHSRRTSWGGDMVAGTDGDLYLITQRNYMYRINPLQGEATLLGLIKNLPESFTTNGAAVNEKGELLIACSNGNHLYYKVDADDLTAVPAFEQTPAGLNTSDLASAYLLPRAAKNNGTYQRRSPIIISEKISIYPNPVTENKFQIQFDKTGTGIHTLQVVELSGKIILNRKVNISGAGQVETIELNPEMARGVYLVKVINSASKTVYSDKVLVH